MKAAEFVMAALVTGMLLVIVTGLAQTFLPFGGAVLVGVAVWLSAAFGLVRAVKGSPAPQRS